MRTFVTGIRQIGGATQEAHSMLVRSPLPVLTLDIELSEPLPLLGPSDGEVPSTAYLLVRLHRVPLATVLVSVPPEGMEAAELGRRLWDQVGRSMVAHARADGLAAPTEITGGGFVVPGTPRCMKRRSDLMANAPSATVIIATRERPSQLQRCLNSVSRLRYPAFDVVVVDNAPDTDATAGLVRSGTWDMSISYVREHRRGLAAAHNRGIQVSTGEVLAFTDDDVEVDEDWLSALVEGFTLAPKVAAVTGLIHPAELRTPTQILLEQHAGFGKGFSPTIFDLGENRPDDPLYPFAAGRFGSGANMAFDAAALRSMGGFDPAMGTGTIARGGDDLVAFFSVIARGDRLVYQPGAVVFHYHRDDPAALGWQSFGYGVGLGSYLTNVMLHHPLMALATLGRSPITVARSLSLSSGRNRTRYDGWPAGLARLERRGILSGPGAYARSRWGSRRAERPGRGR